MVARGCYFLVAAEEPVDEDYRHRPLVEGRAEGSAGPCRHEMDWTEEEWPTACSQDSTIESFFSPSLCLCCVLFYFILFFGIWRLVNMDEICCESKNLVHIMHIYREKKFRKIVKSVWMREQRVWCFGVWYVCGLVIKQTNWARIVITRKTNI